MISATGANMLSQKIHTYLVLRNSDTYELIGSTYMNRIQTGIYIYVAIHALASMPSAPSDRYLRINKSLQSANLSHVY
jgi:hypothetical protein